MNENLVLPLVAIMMALLLDFLPRRPRRGIYFGVTTGMDFARTEAGQAIARQYRSFVWVGLLMTGTCLLVAWAMEWRAAGPLTLVPLLGFAFAGWKRSWRAVQPYALATAAPGGVLTLQPPARRQWLVAAALIPLGLMIASAFILANAYPQLPDPYPIHFGASGRADGFAPKSPIAVFAPLMIGFGVYLMLGFTFYALVFRSRAKARRLNLIPILLIMWFIGLLLSGISLVPLVGDGIPLPVWVVIVIPLAIAVAAIYPFWKLSEQPGSPGDGTPDECWKYGLIYYNPADRAVMVEKRDGLGYTLNFGNPLSWAFIAVAILIVAVPALLMTSR